MKTGGWLLILSVSLLFGSAAWAEEDTLDPSLNERVISVPSAEGRALMLQVTVFTPNGAGPFPLAVLNHGKNAGLPEDEHRYRTPFLTRYFLSRGYAVALPMMRGFAGSQGRFWYRHCSPKQYGLLAAQDIHAVIDFMAQESYVDPNRVVVEGQSFGGWNTLAFGTLRDPRVKALVNFSGGIKDPDCSRADAPLVYGAGDFGAHTRTPSLWFYGDNDSKFSPDLWQEMFDAYTAAGGPAELVRVGRFVEDSHNLLGNLEGLPIWMPKLDAFLQKVGLPGTALQPDYLPKPFPPPSHFAAVGDVEAVPYLLTEAVRESYRQFLKQPLPRIFVISPEGASWRSGGLDPFASAMQDCSSHSAHCWPYAVDNDVVWLRPTPAPPSSGFALKEDPSALPYVNDGGRLGYQKFLAMRKPKAFVISTDGAWSASSLGPDPLAAALASCGQKHAACRLYAVDDQVVWTAPPVAPQ